MTYASIWESLGSNSIWLAALTIMFFTVKGLLWLLVPLVLIRWRRIFKKGSSPRTV